MKKNIYLILLLCAAVACSSPTSSDPGDSNNDKDDPITEPTSQNDELIEELIISDGDNSKTLTFGIQEDYTEGFDVEIDVESPPFTPPGAFFAHFNIPDKKLFTDVKSNEPDKVTWEIEFAPEGDQPIDLMWNTISNKLKGTFTLQDKLTKPDFAINMAAEDNFTLDPEFFGQQFFIVYRSGQSKSNSKSTAPPRVPSTYSGGSVKSLNDTNHSKNTGISNKSGISNKNHH